MQRYSNWHIVPALLILAIWAGAPVAGIARQLWVEQTTCHCPGHAKRTVPNGPTFSPCDDGTALQAGAPSSPVAPVPVSFDVPAPRAVVIAPAAIALPAQSAPPVESPPPRLCA